MQLNNGKTNSTGSVSASPRGPNNRDLLTNAGLGLLQGQSTSKKIRVSSRQGSGVGTTSTSGNGGHRMSRRNKYSVDQSSNGYYNSNAYPDQQQQQQQQLLPQINSINSSSSNNNNNSNSNNPKRTIVSANSSGSPASLIVPSVSNNFTSSEDHSYSAVTSIKGLKPGNPNWTNQDNFFVLEPLQLFCVLDGHGEHGHLVSRRCREMFPAIIRSNNFDIAQSFLQMQSDLNSCDIDTKCSGATCVLATITSGNKLSIYNCGDSRAVLGRRTPNGSIAAHALSNDHKPDRPDERKRILGCGGHLGCRQVLVNQGGKGPVSMPVGPCRVWYQHRGETLGLAMSRSLGDTIVHKCGVSAEPEVLEHLIDEHDEFFMMATDGVWDVVDNNHAVQMVYNIIIRSSSHNNSWSALEASHTVTRFARSRWEKLSPMVYYYTITIITITISITNITTPTITIIITII